MLIGLKFYLTKISLVLLKLLTLKVNSITCLVNFEGEGADLQNAGGFDPPTAKLD